MRRPNLFAAAVAVIVTAILAALLWPGWGIGRAVDEAGTGYAYGHRRPVAAAGSIVLVEIDDASVAELGPWPWEAGTIRKFFEAPFATAVAVVPLVSPGDFAFAPESEEAFWGALDEVKSVTVLAPFSPKQPDVEVAAALSNHPGGGQGELQRLSGIRYETIVTRLPEWRKEAIRSVAYNYLRRHPRATAEEFEERAFSPNWMNSRELVRLAEFWFAQAARADEAAKALEAEGFNEAAFGRLAEIDYAYICPGPVAEGSEARATGFTGHVEAGRAAREAAVASFRGKPLVRAGIAAAKAAGYAGEVRFLGREISVSRPEAAAWKVELAEDGTLLADWTGNAKTAWDAGFRSFSAATLVEAANAVRAVWKGYARYEASIGRGALSKAVEEYERAGSRRDVAARAAALRKISREMSALRSTLGVERAATEQDEDPRAAGKARARLSERLAEIMGLEFDYQVLSSAIEDAFSSSAVVIAPTAAQFAKVRTPWGQEAPEAAIDVAILNAIVNGRTMRTAAGGWWWAVAAAGGVVVTFLAARIGALRALVPAAVIAGGAFFWWFSLFNNDGVLLSASCLAALPGGYALGAAVHAATAGRRRRALRRMFAGHVSREALGGVVKDNGAQVLRAVENAAVLAAGFQGAQRGPLKGALEGVLDRYAWTAREAILGTNGVALEGASDVEGAFAWLGTGEPLESAISAALSTRQRLRLIAEKFEAEGEGRLELRCGVGCGEGVLAAGRISERTLKGSGAAFEKARAAAAEARRWGAGIVICAADRAKAEAVHELRRLDLEGQFHEVLERKGALSVTMRRVREAYEKALEAVKAGRGEEAGRLLEGNVAENGDAPSKELLTQLPNQVGT